MRASRQAKSPAFRIGRCIRVPCAGLRAMLGIERREPSEETGHRQDQDALRKDVGPKAAAMTEATRPATRQSRKTPSRETSATPRPQRLHAAGKSNKQRETEIA